VWQTVYAGFLFLGYRPIDRIVIASPVPFYASPNGFSIVALALLACWIDGGSITGPLVICAAGNCTGSPRKTLLSQFRDTVSRIVAASRRAARTLTRSSGL